MPTTQKSNGRASRDAGVSEEPRRELNRSDSLLREVGVSHVSISCT